MTPAADLTLAFQQFLFGLFRANLTPNLIVAGVGRLYFLLALATHHGGLASVDGPHPRREAFYRVLVQVPLVLLGALHVLLAVAIAAYSFLAGGAHFLAKFRAEKRERNRHRRLPPPRAGQAAPETVPAPSRTFKERVQEAAGAIQRLLWFVGGLLVPVLAGVLLPALGLWTEFLGLVLGGVAFGFLYRRYFHHSLAELVRRRRAGWWGHLSQRARGGIVLGMILVPFLGGTLLYLAIFPARQTEMVCMRDDVPLATDVYLPRFRRTPLPVLLVRTPYGRGSVQSLGLMYTNLGFAVVGQDMRGTGASGGSNHVFRTDYLDGVDTLYWILNQSWADGRVASWGGSAVAINQYYYAGQGPSGLVAQNLLVGTPDLYAHGIFPGGAYREAMIDGWLAANGILDARAAIFQHPTKDAFWNSTSLDVAVGPTFERVNVKAIHVGGWYDCFTQGTIDGFVGYQTRGMARARGNQTLVMGPWKHGAYHDTVGEITFPENAKNDTAEVIWSDLLLAELKGDAAARARYDAYPRVNYYLMGPVSGEPGAYNEWRYANAWPVPEMTPTPCYFHPDGSLEWNPPTTSGARAYLFDPAEPVPTRGGGNLVLPAGPYDQRPVENRSDVVSFTTQPLTAPLEIAGEVTATLHVRSNCSDTDFTVKLTDVYPDGRSMLLCDGIFRARYLEGFDRVVNLTAGTAYEINVSLWSTAYHFPAGHRVRVAVSSSNAPRFDVNPNTGAPLALDYARRAIAQNEILIAPSHPSRVVLPLLPGTQA